MDRKKHIEFFLFLFCFCFITLGFLSFPLISLELCLDAIVDVFFFFSFWSEITVSNFPYAFSDLLYFWYSEVACLSFIVFRVILRFV